MARVVCPLCRTGFEASITLKNVAINCVACGVAFNAAQYLGKDEPAAKSDGKLGLPTIHTPIPSPVAAPLVARPATPRSGSSPLNGAIRNGAHESGSLTPAASDTRTAGLPFLNDGSLPPAAPGKPAELTPLPKPLAREATPEAPQNIVPLHAADRLPAIVLDQSADECPLVPERVAPPAPVAPLAPVAAVAPPLAKPRTPEAPRPARKPARRPLLEGTFGPYDILGEIARGGVGAVFKGRERDSGREIALKVLLEGPDAGDVDRERFRHECETAKALSLPGMVQVYDVGDIDGRPFMAMELVNGKSLDRIVPEKSLTVHDCLVLMKSVAETIGALHEAGYVHRDLKPGNILIDAFNTPKVADFGLVKSLDEITRLTASGLVCGTPAYMAPEQARGDGKAVDPRSDVWALGAVLYEMLTGKPPFQAENALRLMLKITKEPPRPPREINLKVPQDVQAIVLRCLEKNAERRYANGRALAKDIERFLNGEQIEASAASRERLQQFLSAASRNAHWLKAAAVGVAAVLVVSVVARLALAPRSAEPLVERAYAALNDRTLSASQRTDRAEALFREALAIQSGHPKALLGLGQALAPRGVDRTTGKVNESVLAEAFEVTHRAGTLDARYKAAAHSQAAMYYMWMRQHVDEVRERERALEHAHGNNRYREALGTAYWNAGVQTSNTAYYKRAFAEYQGILTSDPEYPRVRGYIQRLREQFLIPDATAMRPRS